MGKPTIEQMEHFFRLMGAGRVTSHNFQGFLEGPDRFATQVQPLVRPQPVIEREFKLLLDYSKSPPDTLRATKCDYIYPWMLEHCPPWQGKGKVEVTAALIDMSGDWERDGSLAAIAEFGLVQAPNNCAIWTLSREHPDLQRKIWIVDPGTVWSDEDGGPCTACLGGDPGGRDADLDGIAGRWSRLSRVLALRK